MILSVNYNAENLFYSYYAFVYVPLALIVEVGLSAIITKALMGSKYWEARKKIGIKNIVISLPVFLLLDCLILIIYIFSFLYAIPIVLALLALYGIYLRRLGKKDIETERFVQYLMDREQRTTKNQQELKQKEEENQIRWEIEQGIRKPEIKEKKKNTVPLSDALAYALQFSSDDGMRSYLNRWRSDASDEEQVALDVLISGDPANLRERLDAYRQQL